MACTISILADSSTCRSVILVNSALDTNAWAQVPLEGTNDLTVIQFRLPWGHLTILNVYNDCNHQNTLDAIWLFMQQNSASLLTSVNDQALLKLKPPPSGFLPRSSTGLSMSWNLLLDLLLLFFFCPTLLDISSTHPISACPFFLSHYGPTILHPCCPYSGFSTEKPTWRQQQ